MNQPPSDAWGNQPQQPSYQPPPPPPPRKKRRTGLIVGGILLGCGILFTACVAILASSPSTPTDGGTQQPADATETTAAPQTTKPPAPVKARTVLKDDGNGAGRTKKFEVTGEYEIRWTWKGEVLNGTDVGVLSITLMRLDGDQEALVANTSESGKDTFNGDAGPGGAVYYLDVNAANGRWTVQVVDTPN